MLAVRNLNKLIAKCGCFIRLFFDKSASFLLYVCIRTTKHVLIKKNDKNAKVKRSQKSKYNIRRSKKVKTVEKRWGSNGCTGRVEKK